MTEWTALVKDSPTAEETVGRIAREIEAFVNGGPDVEHEHLALDDIDTVSVQSSWADARKRKSWIETRKAAAKAKAEKAGVEEEKAKAEVVKAEAVRVASADSSKDGGWGKRRSWGGEEDKAPAALANSAGFFKNPEAQPKAEAAAENAPELKRAEAAEPKPNGASPEPRTTLPAVIPKGSWQLGMMPLRQ
jgi:hypothetical protein